jgi:hypothetical protein
VGTLAALRGHLKSYKETFLRGKHGHPPINELFLRLHILVWDSFCLVGN